MRIEAGSNHHGLVRQANLSGSSTATLTFDYSQDDEGGTVAVQISADGGVTWTTLQSYSLNADQTGQSAVQPVWDMGLDGTGIAVAVIDSGISPDQDFAKIRASASFNASSTSNSDVYRHSTHVAGIVAGNGYASYGLYRGIAPGVDLISLKIADGTGMAYESDTVEAMQWVLDHKDQYNSQLGISQLGFG